MDRIERLVEERVQAAVDAGAFDALPGRGRPLPPDDAERVPAELRAAFRVLRNAGLLPPELEARAECARLGDLLAACRDESEAPALRRRLAAAELRFALLAERRGRTAAQGDYAGALRRRLGP